MSMSTFNGLPWYLDEAAAPPCVEEGVVCQTCTQPLTTYDRDIRKEEAESLLRLIKMYQGDAVHLKSFRKTRGGDFAKFRVWGLVIWYTGGHYKPTTWAIDFAMSRMTIPKLVRIGRMGVPEFFLGEPIYIRDVLV